MDTVPTSPTPSPLARARTWVGDVTSYLRRQGDDPFENAEWVEVGTTLTPRRAAQADRRARERLGDTLGDILAGRLVRVPPHPSEERYPVPRWSLHCCVLDPDCREYLAPARLHVNTPWWNICLGLLPGAGISHHGPGTWGWGALTADIPTGKRCENIVALEYSGELYRTWRSCPLRRGHRGNCLDWKSGEQVTAPTLEEV